jgi:hypothetical protein
MPEERKDPISRKQGAEHLRTELQKGSASLDRGEGQELDMSQVIKAGRAGLYRLSDAEREAVRKGIDAANMGHFAPEDEMDEFYRLHRGE